jgi:outer membrane receptor for ferrienterochelin and colicin
LLCLALVLSASAAFAQGVTTGALSGTVVAAEDGAALPGAIVEAVHEPTGTRYSTVTGADGRFFIANVRVGGPYRVSVNMDGFAPQEVGDLFVKLGQTLDLRFQLQLATVTETVTVVAESSEIINPSRTGAASNVSTEAIETLPTVGRGLEDFARTNPFMVVASENEDPDAISVAGRSSRYNNIQIDGAVNNDLFGLADTGTPGGQAATTPISLDAIQELQLVVSDFDVRQGGFSGGSINAITRSGTNQFAGSVYAFTRDDSLFGDGPDRLGEFGDFSEDQYGFRLGGPISRDKAFFFVNGELTDQTEPTGWSIDGAAGQAFANGDAVEEANLFRNALIDRYGFDPGGLSQNNRDTPSNKFFARVDVNLADNHQLTFRHNFVDADNDINRPGSFTYEFPSETYAFTNKTNSTVFQLNSVLGNDKFNELRVTYQTIEDRRAGRDGVTFPWIEIENAVLEPGSENLPIGDPNRRFDLEFEAGTEPFSTRNALDQNILEITDDFTLIRGNHTLTFGTHNEIFSFDNLFIQNAFGAYEFSTLDDFLLDRPARRFNFTVVPPGQPERQKFDVTQIGLYASDEWAARPNLTLSFGLRVDTPFFPDTPSRNPFTEATYGVRTDELPDGKELIQPRFGFNWDINGDGRSQLRGGAGIFAGRTPYVWISNQYARTGIEQTFIQCFGVPFNPDPFNQDTSCAASGSTGEFNLIDPDFEFPQVLRINLAYDRELPWWGLIGSAELLFTNSIQEIDYKDLNLVQTGTLPFDGRPTFTRLDGSVSGAYLITNTTKGEATNFSLKIERPYRNGFSGFVSYAYGDSKTVNDGSSSRAVSNFQFNEAVDPNNAPESTSDFEVEHRFNASASYQFNRRTRYPTTVSAFYNLQAGRPFSWIYGFQAFPSINSDRYFSNDLFYVPAGPDDVVLSSGTWEQLDAFISSDECLSSHRGEIAPRNCSRAPWNHSLDLRIAQDIPVKNTNLQLTFDILNLVNLFDKDAGVLRFAEFNTVSPVDFDGFDASGRPIYSLNRIVTDPENNDKFDTHNIRSRWRAKLGLRWTF